MSPLSDRRTLALYALLACAVVAVALKVWLPTQRQISRLRAELAQQQQYLVAGQNLQQALESEYGELDRIQNFLDTRQVAVQGSAELAHFFGRMHALARSSGVSTTGFSPEPALAYERVRLTPLKLDCTGTFAELARFLSALETERWLIWIDQLQFEQSGEAGQPLRCRIKLAIFSLSSDETDKAKETAPSTAAPLGGSERLPKADRSTRSTNSLGAESAL